MQVTQFEHLSPLKHLSSLSIHGNPVSELPHCQGYVIFCARSLDVLDGEAVSDYAREGAIRRFTKGEAPNPVEHTLSKKPLYIRRNFWEYKCREGVHRR